MVRWLGGRRVIRGGDGIVLADGGESKGQVHAPGTGGLIHSVRGVPRSAPLAAAIADRETCGKGGERERKITEGIPRGNIRVEDVHGCLEKGKTVTVQ